jgi:hypothetical protein
MENEFATTGTRGRLACQVLLNRTHSDKDHIREGKIDSLLCPVEEVNIPTMII